MDELKPCPFCGGNADLCEADDGTWYIACVACGCGTNPSEASEDDLAAAWNRRSLPPPVPAVPQVKVEWKEYPDAGTAVVGMFTLWHYVADHGFGAYIHHAGITLWRDNDFPTAEAAREECTRRLSLLCAATKTEVA